MYVMTNDGKLFSGELTNWLIDEVGFKQSQFQMYLYYKYAPDGSMLVVLAYVDDCVFWYTYEELVNWFVDTLGKRFHVNFLGYAHLFSLVSHNSRTIQFQWTKIDMPQLLCQNI